MDFEMLKQVGVNVESAMERFMGNNALYAKMLKKILYEPAFGELVHAVSACDRQAALAASHTMKGICGNLSLDPLFDLFSEHSSQTTRFGNASFLLHLTQIWCFL